MTASRCLGYVVARVGPANMGMLATMTAVLAERPIGRYNSACSIDYARGAIDVTFVATDTYADSLSAAGAKVKTELSEIPGLTVHRVSIRPMEEIIS